MHTRAVREVFIENGTEHEVRNHGPRHTDTGKKRAPGRGKSKFKGAPPTHTQRFLREGAVPGAEWFCDWGVLLGFRGPRGWDAHGGHPCARCGEHSIETRGASSV